MPILSLAAGPPPRRSRPVILGARLAWAAFALAAAFFFFEFVVRVEPSLAAGQIAADFRLSNRDFGTLASLFFWVYAPMQLAVGLLLDRFGARRFILSGTLACAAGVLLFTATDNVVVAGFGRALAGFGASFAFVAALWLSHHWFGPERFALLAGAVNALGMLGTAISTILLAGLTGRIGWHPVFLATGLVGLALFAASCLFLRDPPAATACAPDGAPPQPGHSLAAILGSPRLWTIALIGLLFYMPVSVYAGLWGTAELIQDHHLTPLAAAGAVSMIFWGMAGGSIAGGWLSDRLGHRKFVVFAGAALSGLAYAAVLFLPGTAITVGTLLFAAGFFGGFQMLTFVMAKEGQPDCHVGTVIAFVNMIGIAGALIFQPLVGYLLDATGGDYRAALASVPLCAGLAALMVLILPEYRHPEHWVAGRDVGWPAC